MVFTSSLEGDEFNYNYMSGWYLTQMRSKGDDIDFDYSIAMDWQSNELIAPSNLKEVEFKINCSSFNQLQVSSPYEVIADNGTEAKYRVKQPYLNSISVNGNKVLNLEYSSANRMDVLGRKALKYIRILNLQETPVLTYELMQTYFTTEQIATTAPELLYLHYRLKLDELRIHNQQVNTDYNSYVFQYMDEDKLPARNSAAQDFWGYYNGSSSSEMYVGNTEERDDINNLTIASRYYTMTDREPHFDFLKNGTLKKIIYPTGGETEYFYQLPTKSYTRVETWKPGTTVSFQGGLIPATTQEIDDYLHDQYGACDDGGVEFTGTGNLPKRFDLPIHISAEDVGTVTFELNVNSSEPGGYTGPTYDEYFIYKYNNPASYCQIKNAQNSLPHADFDILEEEGAVGSGSFSVNFPSTGTYYLTLFSGRELINYTLTYELSPRPIERSYTDPLAGLRLYKIVDAANSPDSKPMTRYYYYNDFSQLGINDENSAISNQPIPISFSEWLSTQSYNMILPTGGEYDEVTQQFAAYLEYKHEHIPVEINEYGMVVTLYDYTMSGIYPETISANAVPLSDNEGQLYWVAFDDIYQLYLDYVLETIDTSGGSAGGGDEEIDLDAIFTASYSSSAVVHQKLRFNKIVSSTGQNEGCTGENPFNPTNPLGPNRFPSKKLQFFSYNLAQKTKNNLGYSTVSEVRYDDQNQLNGYSVFEFYNEDEDPSAGIAPLYETTLNGTYQK